MVWRRSRDKDICPVYNEPIESHGSKYQSVAWPCVHLNEHYEVSWTCEHLAQSFTGRYNCTVQCRYKLDNKP